MLHLIITYLSGTHMFPYSIKVSYASYGIHYITFARSCSQVSSVKKNPWLTMDQPYINKTLCSYMYYATNYTEVSHIFP